MKLLLVTIFITLLSSNILASQLVVTKICAPSFWESTARYKGNLEEEYEDTINSLNKMLDDNYIDKKVYFSYKIETRRKNKDFYASISINNCHLIKKTLKVPINTYDGSICFRTYDLDSIGISKIITGDPYETRYRIAPCGIKDNTRYMFPPYIKYIKY